MDVFLSRISAILNNPRLNSDAKIEQIGAVIARATARQSILARLVAVPRAQGGYDRVDPAIIDAYFSVEAEPSLEGARLEIYGKNVSSEFVLADLKAKGRRAGRVAELLYYGQKNPEAQRKHWIVGLGQTAWIHGYGWCAVELNTNHDGQRCADLCREPESWHACTAFLSFPL